MPKVAVIVFHKNIGNYPTDWIAGCVDSILNQTHKDFEIFELDYGGDGIQIFENSNFASVKLNNHAEAHNFLLDEVFRLGYDCAFNVNIDDRYTPDRIEKQLPYIEKGYDVISSNFYNIDENNVIIDRMEMHPLDMIAEANRGHNIIAHPVCCYSKKFWTTCTKLNGDQIPKDDFELWKRSYDSGKYKFIILPDYLLYYRVHSKKVSNEGQWK